MKFRAVALTERAIACVEAARAKTVATVNLAMAYTYYEIGRQIVEEEQGGKRRAGYGETLLIDLSKKLTARFGRGWSVPNLKNIRLFYVVYSKRITDAEPTRAKRINTLLCHDKSDTLVEFSLPTEGNRIFASKYKTVLPSKTQLKRVIAKGLDGGTPPSAADCQLLCKAHNRAKGNR